MMVSFALDCTNGHLSLAVFSDDKIYGVYKNPNVKNSAEILSDILSDILMQNHLSPCDIKQIISVAGPGGFSGVRTGTAFISGMVAVMNTPIKTLSSLESLSLSIDKPHADSWIISSLNARRDAVYISVCDADYNMIIPEQLCEIADLPVLLNIVPQNKSYYLTGHGSDFIKSILNADDLIAENDISNAVLFGRNAFKIKTERPHLPIYLRSPDAEPAKKRFSLPDDL